MEQLDLSVLPTTEKDELLKKLLDGTMSVEEARTYLQKTMAGVKNQKSNDLIITLKDGNPESGEVPVESPHAAYRNSMVDYAKEKDKNHAERIEKWAARVEELRIKGLIKEDADGVSFGGLKTASKAVQEKALQDAFGDKLKSSYGRPDHQGNKQRGTKKIEKQHLDDHSDQFGEFILGSLKQLDTMRAWIKENFKDLITRKDELYILQMINPDLFEGMWMKDVNGNYRSFLELSCRVSSRDINKNLIPNFNHDYGAGLFLVQKV